MVIVLLSVLWIQTTAASANLNGPGAIRSTGSWNVPLRIGIRSATEKSRWLETKRQSSLFALSSSKTKASSTHSLASADPKESCNYDEQEWDALFPENNDKFPTNPSTQSASIRSVSSHGTTTTTTGFRRSVAIPAFLRRRRGDDNTNVEEFEDVLPCGAVALSSKVSGNKASFSPSFRIRQQSPKTESSRPPRDASRSSSSPSTNALPAPLPLVFWENMVCGAVSRSVAQTVMHPANTMKTLLQQSNSETLITYFQPSRFPVLFRGAGANFILSVPQGAINFAILEMVRKELGHAVRASKFLSEREEKIGPALDFMSSAVSTICCSVVSTPQMMIIDNIMAGNYRNIPHAVRGIMDQGGIGEFYKRGWLPGLVGKIPSYVRCI